jgi:hypothetical protein
MKKETLTHWLDSWDPAPDAPLPREYRAFFHCFNSGLYYEAHDVLEHLWLRCSGPDRSFFQALIQVAGAFVHFQKHALFPTHPTHSRRLAPGARLLALASQRLTPFSPHHLGLNTASLLQQCAHWQHLATQGNPLLQLPTPPSLQLESP